MIMSIAFYRSGAWNKSKNIEKQGKAVSCSE